MSRLFSFSLLIFLSTINFHTTLFGQQSAIDKNVELISREKLRTHVFVLADSTFKGRASGTPGSIAAGNYIRQCFYGYGLQPFFDNSYFQNFRAGNFLARNVAAFVRGRVYPDEYVVVSAHYDHLGELNGTIYPGADDNASGVALLLQLAEVFGKRMQAGDAPARSIIFVAYDAKEHNLAGSDYFSRTLRVLPFDIIANLNIDQIGCVLEPPNQNPEYVLVLGADYPSPDLRRIIDVANRYNKINLEIEYTYYGSMDFSDLFFQLGDQVHLYKRRVPSILYTSGIHAHTYKSTDKPTLLDYEVLAKRTQLLYLVADDLASRRSWLRRY